MKKAILLGVLAFFAINVITIQTATAQRRLYEQPKNAKETSKEMTSKEIKDTKPTDNKTKKVSSNQTTNSSNNSVQSEMRTKANDAALQAQVEQLLAQKSPVERQNLWRSLTSKAKRRSYSLTDKERIMLRLLNKEFKK